MTNLPGVNVWLALVEENHVHHRAAQEYWQNQASPTVAFCRVSMLGVLRLSTHPRVLSRPLTSTEAWDVYQKYLGEPDVCLLPEPATLDAAFRSLSSARAFAHHHWTDAYIAAFAISANCRVVSFNANFERFNSIDFLHLNP